MNTNQHPADQLGMLLAQVAELTKQADAIKAQLKDVATEAGNYSTASTLFKLLDDLKATLAIKRV